MVRVELVRTLIDLNEVRAFVSGDSALGGTVTFEGAVRSETDPRHGRLRHLEYEAYESMAVKELQNLARAAEGRWGAGRIAIVHRLGTVPLSQVSVVIAAACAHRNEAFEVCRFLIEGLKRDVPIWKQDVFEDGFVQWSPTTRSGPGAPG